MDPPSFTRKILKEEYNISENELNKYQKILAEKALSITNKLRKGSGDSEEDEDDADEQDEDEES